MPQGGTHGHLTTYIDIGFGSCVCSFGSAVHVEAFRLYDWLSLLILRTYLLSHEDGIWHASHEQQAK